MCVQKEDIFSVETKQQTNKETDEQKNKQKDGQTEKQREGMQYSTTPILEYTKTTFQVKTVRGRNTNKYLIWCCVIDTIKTNNKRRHQK